MGRRVGEEGGEQSRGGSRAEERERGQEAGAGRRGDTRQRGEDACFCLGGACVHFLILICSSLFVLNDVASLPRNSRMYLQP